MSKHGIKYYIEGVSLPAMNSTDIENCIINEFKAFYSNVVLTRDITFNNIIVEADNNRFSLEISINNKFHEFTIERIHILN